MAIVSQRSHPELSKSERDLLRRRVKRGAALLDVHKPGWEAKVTKDLEMSDTQTCVLGQVFCNYMRGVQMLNLYRPGDDDEVAAYGFDRHEDDGITYYHLGIAWENLLAERSH